MQTAGQKAGIQFNSTESGGEFKNLLVDSYINVDGKNYYKVDIFAEITKRTDQAIRLLVNKGNRLRRLKAIKFGSMLLIPMEELTSFPFSCAGRSKSVCRYTREGVEYFEIVH